VDDGIEAGDFGDDDPVAVETSKLRAEVLAPVHYGEFGAAGALEELAKIAIREAVERARVQAR
jgi:hypothetical protein